MPLSNSRNSYRPGTYSPNQRVSTSITDNPLSPAYRAPEFSFGDPNPGQQIRDPRVLQGAGGSSPYKPNPAYNAWLQAQQAPEGMLARQSGGIDPELNAIRGGGNVATSIGDINAPDWQSRAAFDLANKQEGLTGDLQDWLQGQLGNVERLTDPMAGRRDQFMEMLEAMFQPGYDISSLPAFQATAPYLEEATRRQQAAMGMGRSGNMAQEVSNNLFQFGAEEFGNEFERLFKLSGMGGTPFDTGAYNNLVNQITDASTGLYDPLGTALGFAGERSDIYRQEELEQLLADPTSRPLGTPGEENYDDLLGWLEQQGLGSYGR